MKTTLCFPLMLLTIITIAYVPYTFAQDVQSEFVVRQIYFYPSDREPSDAYEAKVETIVKDVRQFYADEIERHGFGRKTFTLETDENERTVKHRFIGKLTSPHYTSALDSKALDEIYEHFGRPEHIIYLFFVNTIDNNQPDSTIIDGTGGSEIGLFGGWANIYFANFDNATDTDYHHAWYIIAHELGHAFGLSHDFRDDHYIMSWGKPELIDRLSYCTAKWLDVSRYFNNTPHEIFYEVPNIEMLEPAFVSSPNTIRLRFEITHTEKLHQAVMLIYTGPGPQSIEVLASNNVTTVDCKSLSGNSETIEFVTTDLRHDNEYVELRAIDVYGNFTRKRFPIDMPSLLPDTPTVPISIPDVNLEAKIREELGLAEGSPITNLDMLRLFNVWGNYSQITDLTGLGHAIYLRELWLLENQVVDLTPLTKLNKVKVLALRWNRITDITPLTGLTNLQKLNLTRNQISDITPLTELTKLYQLHIDDNRINDITPLKKLTNLQKLWLTDNQISEVSSLAELVNLQELLISSNQISDITPLKKLTNLQKLWLTDNQISEVSSLAELVNLQELLISSNEISDITSLAELTNIYWLSLSFNRISDITPLKKLTNLQKLNLKANQISDIRPIDELENLKELYFSSNQISDISPLEKLTNLHILELRDNQISDVSPLARLVNLQELRLEGNLIKNRESLLALLRKNPDVKIYLEWGGEPLPVNLSHFRAERTEGGIFLKWTTESELDNAGFYIYRSETKDGEFKVVNTTMVQGAGTTGERNEYIWTDTTAKPNTVYYYRIEDVSHAGVRKLLATVRLRGLVTASGKSITRWADLKTSGLTHFFLKSH